MLVGLPGSGKSTYCNTFPDTYKIHSSDAIREELSGDVNNQNINSQVFQLLHKRVKQDLVDGHNVIYDATNISWKRRKAFLQELNSIKCHRVCDIIATPFEVCLQQNEERDRKVPYEVVERMYRNFDIPWYNEGWNQIRIIYSKGTYKKAYGHWGKFIYETMEFNQDNPYHSCTLGDHCLKCKTIVSELLHKNPQIDFKDEIVVAASLHDNGKPFTQTYEDKKGNPSLTAHYYEHENVGSYNSLFYEVEDNIDKLVVAALIRWHMILHFFKDWKTETKNKYNKEFTDSIYLSSIHFYDMLKILYEGDRNAH